jgi:hypothetical protein
MVNTAAELFAELARHAPARLCPTPLPPLRFVPGMAPEPGVTNRRPGEPGHPKAKAPDPERWRECHDWLYGVDLYNHGYWWEAHEAWEGPWLALPGARPERGLLKGLIQIAAGHLKLLAGAPPVARDLWQTGGEHVRLAGEAAGAPRSLGLAWREWLAALARYAAGSGAGHQPAGFPFLQLT